MDKLETIKWSLRYWPDDRDKMTHIYDIITAFGTKRIYKNIKTKDLYYVHSIVLDCTNNTEDYELESYMVSYGRAQYGHGTPKIMHMLTPRYVQKLSEFLKNFTRSSNRVILEQQSSKIQYSPNRNRIRG